MREPYRSNDWALVPASPASKGWILMNEWTLHASDSSSVHHRYFFTVHAAMVYVLQVCWQLASRIRTFRHIPYTIAVCTVNETPDKGQRDCPKGVEFYSKNKFEKFMHLVGFIVRIFHDARSPERQMLWVKFRNFPEYKRPQTFYHEFWFVYLGSAETWLV